MKKLIIEPKNESELEFIQNLIERLGIKSGIFTSEELEDYGLGLLMEKENRKETVSEDEIFHKLNK